LLAALVIPIGFGVSANAAELVRVLYGPQWTAMTPLMVMFGLSAAVRASTAIAAPLLHAANRVGLALRYNAIGTALMVGAVVLALPLGINAVGFAIALSNLYALVVLHAGLGLLGMGVRHIIQALGPPAMAAALMWLAIDSSRPLTAQWTSHPGSLLALHCSLGAVAYIAALALISRVHLRDFLDVLSRFRGGAGIRGANTG
jgi:hypothetical protein